MQRHYRLWILACLALPALATSAESQKGDSGSYRIVSTVERVVLDLSVKNSAGRYVKGLQKDNFRVYENGRLEPILHFAHADTPVSLGLIVDNSGSMREKHAAVVVAGLAFAKESNPQDQFFVMNFNDHVEPGLPRGMAFSDDLQTLRAALFMGRQIGKTALYDAIASGLRHVNEGVQPKKTLIVVSDGGDNASNMSKHELMADLREAGVTVYTVGLFTDEDSDRNPEVLREMAKVSGGEYFNPQNLDEVIPVFHKIAQDIRNRYTIVYEPDKSIDPLRVPTRSIHVEARAPGYKKLIVRTRTKYQLRPSVEESNVP